MDAQSRGKGGGGVGGPRRLALKTKADGNHAGMCSGCAVQEVVVTESTAAMVRRDATMSMAKANLFTLLIGLPLVIAAVFAYGMIWGGGSFRSGFGEIFSRPLTFVLIMVVGIVVHELIHGLAWALAARKPWRAFRFGFQLKTLTPYAHCTEPMPAWAYRIGVVMPGLLMGLLPLGAGLLREVGWLFVFGLLFTLAAGGDALILWLLRGVPATTLVEDHPSEAGCVVLEPALVSGEA
jgi:hypothetical protein